VSKRRRKTINQKKARKPEFIDMAKQQANKIQTQLK
jgi:hypothetical protein